MITQGDDFPVHQTSEPIAYAGTDRNFYDRYFFNGYNRAGTTFFSAALGVYPHLNIMDGAFCVVHRGQQHNLRFSKHLGMERMDTQIGAFAVKVVQPLEVLAITIGANDSPITGQITFHARAPVVEEPRFIRRAGPRTLMDYTRMTQNGHYEGWIDIAGERISIRPDDFWGTRDRSWGVRSIGLKDPQEMAPSVPPQFFWLWAPINFDTHFSLFALNADETGKPWNVGGVIGDLEQGTVTHVQDCTAQVELQPGSRHLAKATIRYAHEDGQHTDLVLTPRWKFYMSGLGYLHPDHGHGLNKGPLSFAYDTFDTEAVKDCDFPLHLHIQAYVDAELRLPDGQAVRGAGVLEQLVFGPYHPLNLHGFMDLPQETRP
ncbi:hypothetical protein CCO03_12595 [Comamonas serinivorans]|uniref:Uncharacterized protein n=1 Tax=Comamonas serinivorans TaxID=1082851 RepID=A0A1Y0ETT9_9BURK|nr:hypothetical protein [Comamonas serinivorans]ARU06830.1 hypothetical protein CCO03_12595 [Comamonas serinivorans]